jgi:glycerol uptake facilitator-like aquaporin
MAYHTPLQCSDLATRAFASCLGGNREFILDPKNLHDIPIL